MSSRLAAYRPPNTTLPSLVRRADVGAAAWHALLRDEVLRPLWGDVGLVADLDDTPALRSAALADLVPRRGVVGRCSAAWVHTGRRPPARVDVLVASRSHRADPDPRRTAAEATLPADDVERIGPLKVTTVQRTGTDVARWVPAAHAPLVLVDLCAVGFDPHRALRDLDAMPGQRGVRAARDVLRAL
ncbi:hypothetical protein Cch01nite_11300 [Cellulomonas chitinilytica]|uniref:AbiEi antitoxin C-terminal domain-containing protein n=1 Tax=Cellulomonas chitinilytica TaxID=398759 RepID=A0A919U0G2_9CELL|nr:hypothetical protein [Cellulomonas chitinilytica]GIG20406.1 hypothetical protein Cch01nite_11300 [Cellulomonas chitinilytica]